MTRAGIAAVTTSTASTTIAHLIGRAAERHGGKAAASRKVDGAWPDTACAEVRERVREIARGLVDLGLPPGERMCIRSTTRAERRCRDVAIASVTDRFDALYREAG